jgi:hypothetical protein
MKKLYTVLTLLMAMFMMVQAQEIVVVEPGVGTLNAAIAADSSTKIYQLQAGEFYQLDGVIENNGWHLQIIGEEPVDGGLPATLQSNQDLEGNVFPRLFDAKGDITLKNLYIMAIDLTGQKGGLLRNTAYGARTIVDNCILEPATSGNGIICQGGMDKIYFTNNQVFNMGHMLSPNDGHFFVTNASTTEEGLDTLYVENNTFVCMGTNMHMGAFTAFIHNFVLWNHNTFVNQKSQFNWSLFENELYFTNNLMVNAQTQPWAIPWGAMPGHDKGYILPGIIYADTIQIDSVTYEPLPSTRISYVNYNNLYRLPAFYELVEEINALDDNDTVIDVYHMPLVWEPGTEPNDTLKSRETLLFEDDETFPHWSYEYDLNWQDMDPQWTDPKIYESSDAFAEWTSPATYMHALGFPVEHPKVGPATEWTQWHWDPDGDETINEAWPVFDGTYSNATLLTASIEGLPLGDLNWYPEKKALWEAEKEEIFAHIKSGNTEKYSMVSIGSNRVITPSFSRVYPNPVEATATIEFSLDAAADVEITVYNSVGQQVRVLMDEMKVAGMHRVSFDREDLTQGVYFYSIKAGDKSETHKMIFAK